MAWSEQCKFAFRTSATAKLGRFKDKNRKITVVLKELCKESDIPFKTLKRWWYEKEKSICPKNGPNMQDKTQRICIRCGLARVYLNHGKPHTEASKHYGLCNSCRSKQCRTEVYNRDADETNGRLAECPHCHSAFYIKP